MACILDFGISTQVEDVWDLAEEVVEALGFFSVSSGIGFGYRDVQLEVKGDPEQAKERVRQILKSKGLREGTDYYVSVYEED